MTAQEFFPIYWKEKQASRPEPMRKPFGSYTNDKLDFAEAYHREKLKEENPLEISLSEVGIGFNKLGQKEERERILGIIKSHDFWFITDREELIEKIKG